MNLSITSHTVLVCSFRHYSRFTSLAHLSTVSQPFMTDRAKSPLTRKAEILEKVLGMKPTMAKVIVRQLGPLPISHYNRFGTILQQLNFLPATETEAKDLLSMPFSKIDRHAMFLQELGISNKVKPSAIISCQNIMNVHLGIFKGYVVLDRDMNMIEYLLAQLPKDTILQEAAREKLKDIDTDNNKQFTMVNIRNILFSTYLNWKWPDIEYDFILRRVEHGLKDVPIGLKTLQLTLQVILNIGYDIEKIFAYPELLSSDPKSVQLFLATYQLSGFLGHDARIFLLDRPVLVARMHFDTLCTNLKALQDAEIPDSTILGNDVPFMTYNSQTLKKRLDTYLSCPELGFLSYNSMFPVLLKNIDTAVVRVRALRAIDRSQITIKACTCPPDEFKQWIQVHRPIIPEKDDKMKFIAHKLKKNVNKVVSVMKLHPHHNQLDAINAKMVISFLSKQKFTNEQIFHGIHLILYPVERVATKLNEISHRLDMQPFQVKCKDPRFLHTLLYYLEEQYGFSGSGVFSEQEQNREL